MGKSKSMSGSKKVSRFIQIPKKVSRQIDILISAERHRGYSKLSTMIAELYGYDLSPGQVKYRLGQIADMEAEGKLPSHLKVVSLQTQDEYETTNDGVVALRQDLRTMEQKVESVFSIDENSLDADERKAIVGFKKSLRHALRLAKELFADVPYVGYLNYAINAMQIRIAKRLELEARLNLPVKDTVTDMETFVGLIEKAIKLQQSLGVLPLVDKKGNALNVNVGVNVSGKKDDGSQVLTEKQIKSVDDSKRTEMISKALDMIEEVDYEESAQVSAPVGGDTEGDTAGEGFTLDQI